VDSRAIVVGVAVPTVAWAAYDVNADPLTYDRRATGAATRASGGIHKGEHAV